jgi:hypothetical protein
VRRLMTSIKEKFRQRDVPVLPPVPIATVVRDRMNRALRRRLSDRVLDVCHEACMSGDLQTADELVGVLERMHARREVVVGDRRISDEDVLRMRDDIASRKAEHAAAAAHTMEAAAE